MLTVNAVTYEYRNAYQTVRAVDGVSWTFQPGQVYAIVGASGSGKTTLLSLLAGLDVPTSGSIALDGETTAQMDRDAYRLNHISVIYQNFNLFAHLTALENVAYPLYVGKMPRKAADALAGEKLLAVGIKAEQFKRLPNMLSGGEQQRVAIARALINSPRVLLADEPTGNLDHENAGGIMRLLEDINSQGTTVLVITHSQELVRQMGKRVITMDRGSLIGDTAGLKIPERRRRGYEN